MREANIKISIIMPSLNVREYIGECIESVINQTLKEIEIICVDAGSDDGTLEILEDYAKKDNRIILIHSDKKSYGYQVNLGISNSNGEYIGIVETDDYVDEKMYETLYSLTKNECDIAKADFYFFHDINPPKFFIDHYHDNLPINKEFTIYEYPEIIVGHPSIWAAIYKKSFLDENNIKFMEVPGGGWVDNPFFHETAICAKAIVYSNEPLYYYRELNPNSSSNDISDLTMPMKRMEDTLDVLDKYGCTDENILSHVYSRIFMHIWELMKIGLGSQKEELMLYFRDLVNRMDKNVVNNQMDLFTKIGYNIISSKNSILFKILSIFIGFIYNFVF